MIRQLIAPLAIGSLLLGSASAFAFSAASSVDYGNIHGYMTVSDATITGVSAGTFSGNEATVAPGANLSLSFNSNIVFENSNYCPGCIIQEYLAWDGNARALGATPPQRDLFSGVILSSRNLGSFNWQTSAPTTPGEYYIGGASTLQYQFVPVAGGLGGIGGDQASFKITVSAVPEPSSVALMFAGLGLMGAFVARKKAQR
jgi:hypothetical protein